MAKICNIPDIYNCSIDLTFVGFEIPLNERQKSILICISIGLIGMNIVVFYLINSILKREMELRENKIFLERVKNETEMYRSISENYDKQRKREHEYQNHMQVISDLLKNKKYQELERFIDESNSDTAGKIDKIDTNHVIVNSILNTKYREAREKKIVFVVKVNDLSTLKIKDEDIVLILSNLLNNAIEACEKSERPVMKVKIAYSAKTERCSARNGSLPCWLIKLLAFYTSIATWKV